ncbi:MAG TPA: sodium:solute symporter family protein [Dehalococcoidia bacterium]|nr:sodium:solute symporter family protein [Dehalococcoidia bacterium]
MDLAIIILYFAVMVAIGAYVYRKRQASSNDGFFVANRSGTTLLIAGSLCATFIGSSVVVGMVGRGYRMGFSGAWWLLVGTIGLLILGFFFARKVRRFGLYTLPELVEGQFGSKAGLAASVLIVVAWIAIIAAQIIAAGKVLTVFTSLDLSQLMTISAFIFVLYTVLGGQYSVIRTDLVQFGILIVGILVTLGFVVDRVGGVGELASSLPSEHFSLPVSSSFGWYELLVLLILTGSTYVVGPDMYSRLFCARDEAVARKSAFYAGLIAIPVAFIIVLIGMAALVLFPDIHAQHPELSYAQASELAYPTVIENVLPVGVAGLVAAALLAAIMSSADTVLLTTSTILTQDIYKRISPNMTERTSLIITRLGVIVIGAIALVIAWQRPGIISSLLLAYTIFTSGIVVPVIAGFYRDKLKVNSAGAIAAIIGGGGTALAINRLTAAGWLNVDKLELVGFGVCIILLFGVSWITAKTGLFSQQRG